MNKKLFTLAAALMMGSAFTVNAQTYEVAGTTKVTDLGSWYYIGNSGAADETVRHYLSAYKNGTDEMTALNLTANQGAANVKNDDQFLWKVSVITKNGVIDGYQLTNKKTGGKLTFNSAGSAVAATNNDKLNTLGWNIETSGLYQTNGGVITTFGTNTIDLNTTTGAITLGAGATKWALYTQDPTFISTTQLNNILGDGFALNFPKVNPQPLENVFDQKLTAYFLTAPIAPVTGTYFAVSVPQTVKDNGGFMSQAEFNASTFVALSPVDHYGVNALPQSDGIGFKFITVSGRELVASATTSKNQISANNAIFTVSIEDAANKPEQYTLTMRNVHVKKDASKDDQSIIGTVYVDAFTSVGVTYVTTSLNKTTAVLKVSDTNMAKAADLLKADAPAVFNVQFLSNYAANGWSEYGKFLGLTSNGATFSMLAQPEAFVDLDVPQNQWVISAVNGQEFTFTSREDASVSFTASLRKTATENVYQVTASTDVFDYGVVSGNRYTIAGVTVGVNSKLIKLIPATVSETAGFADLTPAELSELATLKFEVASATISKDIYVTADSWTSSVGVSQDASQSAKWEIVKFESLLDSIHGTTTYAYVADGKVKTKDVEDKAFTTYAFKLHENNSTYYLNWNSVTNMYDLTSTTANANIPRFAIKEQADGTSSLVSVGLLYAPRDYATNFNAATVGMALNSIGGLAQQNIYETAASTDVNVTIEIATAAPSLEAVGRHASFQSVNGGFLAIGAENDAVIAATSEESENLTFWLDTADVEAYTPSFFISQAAAAETKAAEPRLFLYNAADSADYYNPALATYETNYDYYLSDKWTVKAIFRPAVLESQDSLTTVVNGKEVGVTAANGLDAYKFQIVLADAATEGEYVIKSVKDATYLTNKNGKVGLTDDITEALVVTVGEGIATANEAIAAEAGVQVNGGQGVVTVQGAAGKVVTVANILGQTIANQVAASDNVTIAVPAGIVVVAVDGEATKVIVK